MRIRHLRFAFLFLSLMCSYSSPAHAEREQGKRRFAAFPLRRICAEIVSHGSSRGALFSIYVMQQGRFYELRVGEHMGAPSGLMVDLLRKSSFN